MSFTAKYRSVCESCDDEIAPGQEVEYTYNHRLVHANYCPSSLDALGKPRPVCPRCFLELPATGVCEECS